MGYFGNLYYAEKERPFIGLPIEDIKATTKLLSERYNTNKDQYDYLDMMEQNLNTLDEKDQYWVKERIRKTREGISNFTNRGDWWNAGSTVKGLFKDYATDKAVQLTQVRYNKYLEYQKWLDEEGSKLNWSERQRVAAMNAARKNSKSVSFIDASGNEIEYNDENKDKGRFVGSFDGRILGENLSLDKYVWDTIGAKYGEPDVRPRSGYSNNQQGYWIVTKGKETFISEDEVQRTVENLMETDSKVKRWFEDKNYLQRNEPVLALEEFNDLSNSYLNGMLRQRTYKGNDTEKRAEFNKQFGIEMDKLYKSFGLDESTKSKFDEKIANRIPLTEEDQTTLLKIVSMNQYITKNMAMDNAASRYGYHQLEQEYTLKDDEMWQFKAKHALEQQWSFNPAFGKSASSIVDSEDIKAITSNYGSLLNQKKELEAKIRNAKTPEQANGFKEQLAGIESKLTVAKDNITEIYSHGDDKLFMQAIYKTQVMPTLVSNILNNANAKDLTVDNRRALVNYINTMYDAYNEIQVRNGKPTLDKKYSAYDKIDNVELSNISSVLAANGSFSNNAKLAVAAEGTPGNNLSAIITSAKDRSSIKQSYNDFKTDMIMFASDKIGTGGAFKEYANSVMDYYEQASSQNINFTIFTSADKDDPTGGKSTLYNDYIKGVTQLVQRGDAFSTMSGQSLKEVLGSLSDKVYVIDEKGESIKTSPSLKNVVIDPAVEAYNGKLYFRASLVDDKGKPLVAKDNDGNLRPVVKFISSDEQPYVRQMNFKLGKMLYAEGIQTGNSEFTEQGISIMANANYTDLTAFKTNQVVDGYKDVVPFADINGNVTYIGIQKVGSGIKTYTVNEDPKTHVKSINFQDPLTVRTSQGSTNQFNDIQDFINKATTSKVTNY